MVLGAAAVWGGNPCWRHVHRRGTCGAWSWMVPFAVDRGSVVDLAIGGTFLTSETFDPKVTSTNIDAVDMSRNVGRVALLPAFATRFGAHPRPASAYPLAARRTNETPDRRGHVPDASSVLRPDRRVRAPAVRRVARCLSPTTTACGVRTNSMFGDHPVFTAEPVPPPGPLAPTPPRPAA